MGHQPGFIGDLTLVKGRLEVVPSGFVDSGKIEDLARLWECLGDQVKDLDWNIRQSLGVRSHDLDQGIVLEGDHHVCGGGDEARRVLLSLRFPKGEGVRKKKG